jgi:uncharacterized membrane protein
MSFATLKQRVGFAPNFRVFLAAGQITLVAGIVLSRLDYQLPWMDFLEGMLIGFATVANLAGIFLFGRSRQEKGEKNE